MEIKKYIKKTNGKYQILLEDNSIIETYEDVILNNKLLYKDKITLNDFEKITHDNLYQEAYQKAFKYIEIRLRSVYEMENYLLKKYDKQVVDVIINKLQVENLLNDLTFARAFVNDKMNFTTMGPYKIKNELKKHNIDINIIEEVISQIDLEKVNLKIQKQIDKILNANQNNKTIKLKNKIYKHLFGLGYPNDMILKNLSIKFND